MTRPNVICDSCGQALKARDAFCEACGARVSEAKAGELRARARAARTPRTGTGRRWAARARTDKVNRAGVWLMILAVIFAGFGTIYGFVAKGNADDAELVLGQHDDADPLTIEGETRTVGEWRKAMRTEVTVIFVTNYLLAGIYVGLFFLAKNKPFPAFVTALCVFIALQLLNAVIDPTTIVKGILIKVLALAALIGGVKASLDQRAAREGFRARSAARRRG